VLLQDGYRSTTVPVVTGLFDAIQVRSFCRYFPSGGRTCKIRFPLNTSQCRTSTLWCSQFSG